MAYAEKRGKGPRPWRVKYKVPGGEASQSGFETKQAALGWGRDQEAKVRAGTWTDLGAGEITVSEWIDRWKATQDVGPRTTANREYRIRRFIRPYWGKRTLNSLTGEEIAVWERKLPAAEGVSRSTAKDARSLLHTILGDAAAARPPLIPFNPAVRPRNRGRRTGRGLDRNPQRAWATPLEVLLVAERAALLAGRDDEFTLLITIGYTGMRWGETIGLERDLLLPSLINVEWQLREVSGRFHRLPPKDDSYRGANVAPLTPVDLPPFLAGLLRRPGRQARTATVHLRRRARRKRPVCLPRPRRRPPPEQQLRAADLPAGLRRAAPASQRQPRQAGDRGRRGMAGNTRCGMAASRAGKPFAPPSGRGTQRLISTEDTGRCPSCGHAVRLRLDGRIVAHNNEPGHCPGSGEQPAGDAPLACWLPVRDGLTPHGLRHGHKTWMAEDGIPEILAEQRLGHQVPGMRGLYAHASQQMREKLTAALQARWDESLRQRAAIDPHSPVPLLDNLLAPFRTAPAGHSGPAAR